MVAEKMIATIEQMLELIDNTQAQMLEGITLEDATTLGRRFESARYAIAEAHKLAIKINTGE